MTAALLAALPVVVPALSEAEGPTSVAGVDHVPIAVRDLDAARERYRALGFAFKPGRPHSDGIRNLNLKFPDGTQLELITVVGEPGSSLAERYARHLEGGDGPRFAGLWAPDAERLDRALAAAGRESRPAGALVAFPIGGPLDHLFFGRRNHAPNDLPEHFAHPNGAESLVGIWLASEGADGEPSAERRLLADLGVPVEETDLPVPFSGLERSRAPVAFLGRSGEGFVILLPETRRIRPERPIVGVTVRVRDLDTARNVLAASGIEAPAPVAHQGGRSLFLPPETALGLWLELREPRTAG